MTKPNIKPCPFCGEFLYYQPDWYNWVHPLGDDGYETPCIGNKIIIRDNNRTIAAWNTRADTVDAKLKEAARELDAIAEPIRVKPLVWMVTDDAKLGISFTNFGQYVIDMGSTQGKFCALFNEASVVVIKDQWWFGTIDEAKAAAQADYARRILAALEGGTR